MMDCNLQKKEEKTKTWTRVKQDTTIKFPPTDKHSSESVHVPDANWLNTAPHHRHCYLLSD